MARTRDFISPRTDIEIRTFLDGLFEQKEEAEGEESFYKHLMILGFLGAWLSVLEEEENLS